MIPRYLLKDTLTHLTICFGICKIFAAIYVGLKGFYGKEVNDIYRFSLSTVAEFSGFWNGYSLESITKYNEAKQSYLHQEIFIFMNIFMNTYI